MALLSNALATYEAIGNREDLSDEIYRIDPIDTPFLSSAQQEKATAVNHEWQTQALAAAATNNQQFEGNVYTAVAVTPTVRLGNIAQISSKIAAVTGTQEAVRHAGRGDEMAYQEMLKGMELKRDMESSLVGSNVAKVVGADGTARVAASILSWIGTNTNKGGGAGADPATQDGNAIRTDGTQRTFSENNLKGTLKLCFDNGGRPDLIMAGSFNKQQFSTFTGRASPIENTSTRQIIAAVDVYESDFGRMRVIPNRFMRARDVLVLQMDMWAVAYLNGRKFVSFELAKTADADTKVVLSEYTLVARNQKSSGIVADNTTT